MRKASLKEKKERNQNEALLQAIKVSSQTLGFYGPAKSTNPVKLVGNLSWDALPEGICSFSFYFGKAV